jgi:hypothetical protein
MNLRFSLLGLVGLVSFAALACAALVEPGDGWLSVVVTIVVFLGIGHALRAVLHGGESRAASVGWLVFVVGYLALALGPWIGEHIGPGLLSSKGLTHAQVRWRKEDPNNPSALNQVINLNTGDIDLSYMTSINSWVYLQGVPASGMAVPGPNHFRLSGHWLFAWLAGWLGAALAVRFHRRRAAAAESPAT